MAVNSWTPEKNQVLTYLWYLGVKDMEVAEKFTGIPKEKCSLKYSEFPEQLPESLKHKPELDTFPQRLLRTSLPENLKIVENKICSTGLFTAKKVYNIWLQTLRETSRQGNFSKIWTEDQEKIIVYLWYAGIKSGRLASEFTGMTVRQCSGKLMQFPGGLPDELAHDHKINKKYFAAFEELEKYLTEKGLKTADEVYNVWQNSYRNTHKVRWSSSDLTKLCKTVFFSKKENNGRICWAEITRVFTNKTKQQCESAYRVHRKKIVVSSGNIDKLQGDSSSRSLCKCFLKDEATTTTEDIGDHDFEISGGFVDDFVNRNDMWDPTYTLFHQIPFFDTSMGPNFHEEGDHNPLYSL